METALTCPHCHQPVAVPPELLGQPVYCPMCGEQFDAKGSPPGIGAEGPAGSGEEDLTGSARGQGTVQGEEPPESSADERVPCPHCGQLIRRRATRCRFCDGDVAVDGNEVGTEEYADRPWERREGVSVRRDCEPHRGPLVLTLGIISVVAIAVAGGVLGLPFGIVAWIMGQRDLRKMRAKTMDPSGYGLTQAGWVCGIIGTILDSLATLLCFVYLGVFAWFMSNAIQQAPTAPRPVPAPTAPAPAPGVPAEDEMEP